MKKAAIELNHIIYALLALLVIAVMIGIIWFLYTRTVAGGDILLRIFG